jgi:hypothetical protein
MRATFQNVASSLSLTLIFTLVVAGLSASQPGALYGHLTAAGIPSGVATQISGVPPVGALFAAFLGYNPMATLIPHSVLAALPAATQTTLLSPTFFPQLLAGPFHDGLQIAFTVCVVLSLGAAAASWMRGRRYIHDYEVAPASATATVEGFAAMAAGITRADIEAVEPAVEPAGSTVPAQIGERAALG